MFNLINPPNTSKVTSSEDKTRSVLKFGNFVNFSIIYKFFGTFKTRKGFSEKPIVAFTSI